MHWQLEFKVSFHALTSELFVRSATQCLLSVIDRHHNGQPLSRFFCLGRKQLPVAVDRNVCQFSRGRHVTAEFFQMSFLDPPSISSNFAVTTTAWAWQLKVGSSSLPTALHPIPVYNLCSTVLITVTGFLFKRYTSGHGYRGINYHFIKSSQRSWFDSLDRKIGKLNKLP